jgi:hypothetical protein
VSAAPVPDFPELWAAGTPWPEYLRPEMQSYELWRGIREHVVIPDWAVTAFGAARVRKLLVLGADWCGDAVNTVPVLAGLAAAVDGLELRLLERDGFPALMDRYLTNGSRSIPIAIGLDAEFRELGHWGPRPSVLQAWVMANKAIIPTPQRYAYARRWYAKDRGESTLRELLDAVGGDR